MIDKYALIDDLYKLKKSHEKNIQYQNSEHKDDDIDIQKKTEKYLCIFSNISAIEVVNKIINYLQENNHLNSELN